MDSEKRKRPPNFRLEIPGDENLKNRIQEKFQEIKRYLTTSLNKPVNNANIIKELLDVWKKLRHENVSSDEIHVFPSTYAQVAKKDVNQDLFITAEKSIITYGEICEAHSNVCRVKFKNNQKNNERTCYISKTYMFQRQITFLFMVIVTIFAK